MDARDRLLSVEEIGAMRSAIEVALAQDVKTLRALRPIVEDTAYHLCHHPVSFTLGPGLGAMSHYKDCGHCATCQARAVLAEMDAQGKGKEEPHETGA